MIVIVCGGRDYTDMDGAFKALDNLHTKLNFTQVVEGGARGADFLGRCWAAKNRIPCKTYSADWALHGRAAGMLRNKRMLEEGKPNLVVAFPGGRGTKNMITIARQGGISVVVMPPNVTPLSEGTT